jgi:hypothetical protein
MAGKCNNIVQVGYNERTDKIITVPCGMTAPDGSLALCDDCIGAYEQKYPQGWVNIPGDLCKHGRFVGDPYGPDYICGECEDGR